MKEETKEALDKAVQDMIDKLRHNNAALFAACPPPSAPHRPGSMQNEVGKTEQYFVPCFEFRSGIPRLESAPRHERYVAPAGWTKQGSTLRLLMNEPIREPKTVGMIPMQRQAGVLVTVSCVWDRSLTRIVKEKVPVLVGGQIEQHMVDSERKGDWRLLYRFAPRMTPLAGGIKTVFPCFKGV